MADKNSMDPLDMCIEASKSIHMYDKEVELKDFNDSNDNSREWNKKYRWGY